MNSVAKNIELVVNGKSVAVRDPIELEKMKGTARRLRSEGNEVRICRTTKEERVGVKLVRVMRAWDREVLCLA